MRIIPLSLVFLAAWGIHSASADTGVAYVCDTALQSAARTRALNPGYGNAGSLRVHMTVSPDCQGGDAATLYFLSTGLDSSIYIAAYAYPSAGLQALASALLKARNDGLSVQWQSSSLIGTIRQGFTLDIGVEP